MPETTTPAAEGTAPPAATPPPAANGTSEPPVGGDSGDAPLGEAGEKALQAWKDRAKAAETEAKRAKTLEVELDQLRTAQMSDQERAVKEAADKARTDTLGEVNKRLFAAELRAEAAGKVADPDLLADPEVAVRLLGLDEIPVTPSGDIDTEAISAAVASLLEAKPYLAGATPPGTGTPAVPDLGQGARGTNTTRQLTRSDLQAMSPEQIDQARNEGLLDDLMAGRG